MKGVIQIGAHYAEEYEGWLSEGATNFIFFEPVLANYNKMVQILPKSEHIKTYRMALGNETSWRRMYCETVHKGKSCSLLKPLRHLEQYPDIVFDQTEEVEVRRLDDINYNKTLYDHLHIDVQGYELEVLKGAVESLKHFTTVETEVHRAELFEGCSMYQDVCNFLFAQDFNLDSIYWRGNTWGDAKFRKLPKV